MDSSDAVNLTTWMGRQHERHGSIPYLAIGEKMDDVTTGPRFQVATMHGANVISERISTWLNAGGALKLEEVCGAVYEWHYGRQFVGHADINNADEARPIVTCHLYEVDVRENLEFSIVMNGPRTVGAWCAEETHEVAEVRPLVNPTRHALVRFSKSVWQLTPQFEVHLITRLVYMAPTFVAARETKPFIEQQVRFTQWPQLTMLRELVEAIFLQPMMTLSQVVFSKLNPNIHTVAPIAAIDVAADHKSRTNLRKHKLDAQEETRTPKRSK